MLAPFIDSIVLLKGDKALNGLARTALSLDHQHNSLRFKFAFPAFDAGGHNRFQYKLAGFDEQWSNWSHESHKDYTRIGEGDYRFELRAKNVYGETATAKAFVFTIVPPWYRRWWAWMVYLLSALLLAFGAVFLLLQYRTRSLNEKAAVLEQRVAQRTKMIGEQKASIEQLLEQKNNLFANISHEFRTPLTLILSPVDALLSRYKSQPAAKDLTLIKRNARRLLRMVDQLLEFAKLEQSGQVKQERVSLQQTLEIIIASFEVPIASKKMTLQLTAFDDVQLILLPDSLNKILLNLLSNALKYTPDGGEIDVRVQRSDEWVEIAVRDSGIGIAEADHQIIFKRFNRATHNHGEVVPGVGIGLALVKELVEANQGSIRLSSQLQQGSTFTVTLPLNARVQGEPAFKVDSLENSLEVDSVAAIGVPTDPDAAVADGNSAEKSAQRQKTILIIDDNADMRDLLHRQLSGQYDCVVAENGRSGLDIAREQLPDLIISDIMMPVMDGYQFSRLLKEDELTCHIPLILLTAKGSVENRIKGLRLQVDDYLAKPYHVEELLLRIDNMLAVRELLTRRFGQAFDAAEPQQMKKLGLSVADQAFYDKVNRQLLDNYQLASFNVLSLCHGLGVSEKQLQRKLKALFDKGFSELLRNYRLNKASELLLEGKRVSQVYDAVGFSSHSYFSSCFKAKFGQSPKAYQPTVTPQ